VKFWSAYPDILVKNKKSGRKPLFNSKFYFFIPHSGSALLKNYLKVFPRAKAKVETLIKSPKTRIIFSTIIKKEKIIFEKK
jgi:hypothetical protein